MMSAIIAIFLRAGRSASPVRHRAHGMLTRAPMEPFHSRPKFRKEIIHGAGTDLKVDIEERGSKGLCP